MIVLGIETATHLCGVGLAGPDGCIAEYRMATGGFRGEQLAGAVSTLLRDAGLKPSQIDGVAVSIGPGSFTGLRVGLAFAKGFVLGTDKPMVAVATLDAMAFQVPVAFAGLCVLLHSKKNEVYRGLYRPENGKWVAADDPAAVPIDCIAEGCGGSGTAFVGEGVLENASSILGHASNAQFLPPLLSMPSGCAVAMLGRNLLEEGIRSDADKLVPRYIKRFQGVA
ncbi:MAG TPA: tRNA (adenosine(37)-N6)-threonylcarbamoyltransferase complex dimerization subunit type 1 TsaB [bacterium]